MDLIIPIILFAIGLIMLIKGGDWFVDGATGIAHRFHIPEILRGATVVSIGTTLPEVMVSATGAMQGAGSNGVRKRHRLDNLQHCAYCSTDRCDPSLGR